MQSPRMTSQLRNTLGNHIILAPGPTTTPTWLKEMMITLHHRTLLYRTILGEMKEMLLKLFDAPDGIVLIYPGVGTTMMESVLANFIRKSAVYVINTGFFADKWAEIAAIYGADVDQHHAIWGKDYLYHDVYNRLARNSSQKTDLVLMQAGDTSTGLRNNLVFVGTTIQHEQPDALFAVDAVLEAGISPIKMKHEGIDILVASTQKAFMLPPGLSFIILREKAIKKITARGALDHSYFLDFEKEIGAAEQQTVRFTHPTAHVSGLWALLKIIFEEIGEEKWYRMHEKRAFFARTHLDSLGFKNFTSGKRSDAVSVFLPPEGFSAGDILRAMDEKGFVLADGMGKLHGSVVRMSHFLGVAKEDLERFFTAIKEYIKSA